MVLWLKSQHMFASKEEHHNLFAFAMLAAMVPQRIEARAFLQTLPAGGQLLATERPPCPAEPDETDEIP